MPLGRLLSGLDPFFDPNKLLDAAHEPSPPCGGTTGRQYPWLAGTGGVGGPRVSGWGRDDVRIRKGKASVRRHKHVQLNVAQATQL